MIKIAYLLDTIHTDKAGTEKQLLQIIKKLDKFCFSPCLICLHESQWMRSNELPCPVYILNYTGLLKPSLINIVHKLKKYIHEQQFDIVQTFFEDAMLVAALTNGFGPLHATLLASRRDLGLGAGEPWYHKFYKLIRPIANKQFDGIVANSDSIKEYIITHEKVAPDKITVIYNGITPAKSEGTLPEVFSKNSADVWLVIVANLKPVKRVDLLLTALQKLKTKDLPLTVHAVVLGEGGERENLHTLCQELGLAQYVHFEGSVEDVSAYLRRADIGILCSDKEGLSNAILEYMSHGLPVVATRVGGNPELVTEDTGLCVPADDPQALAEAIARLAIEKELRKEMGRNALQRIQNDFLWEQSIDNWQKYYSGFVA